jgi:hypothetical protein
LVKRLGRKRPLRSHKCRWGIILKWIRKELDGRVWSGFIWLKIGLMAGSHVHININVNLISAQGNMIFMSHLSMCFESLSLKTAKIFPLLISIILKLSVHLMNHLLPAVCMIFSVRLQFIGYGIVLICKPPNPGNWYCTTVVSQFHTCK